MSSSQPPPLSILAYQELQNFIMDTNSRSSINSGPWPNTALQIVERILLLREKRFHKK